MYRKIGVRARFFLAGNIGERERERTRITSHPLRESHTRQDFLLASCDILWAERK